MAPSLQPAEGQHWKHSRTPGPAPLPASEGLRQEGSDGPGSERAAPVATESTLEAFNGVCTRTKLEGTED